MKIIFSLLLFQLLINAIYSQTIDTIKYEFDKVYAKPKPSLPFYINGNMIKDDVGANVAFSCLILPFSPSLPPGYFFFDSSVDKKYRRSGGYIYNLPVKIIFQILYGKGTRKDPVTNARIDPTQLPSSQVCFREVDTTGLVYFLQNQEMKKNMYSIQVTSSKDVPEWQRKSQMISAIEAQFGLKTYFEKQKKKCLVISRNSASIPEYVAGEKSYRMSESYKMDPRSTNGIISINNIWMEEFIDILRNRFHKTEYPIVDETGFSKKLGKIDITVADRKLTFEILKIELAKYGMKFSFEEREVDMLVITKAN